MGGNAERMGCSARLASPAKLNEVVVFMVFFWDRPFVVGGSPCTGRGRGGRAARGSSLQRGPRVPPPGAARKGRPSDDERPGLGT